MKRLIFILLLVLLVGCGPKVESINYSKNEYFVGVGDNAAIEYDIYPENANKSSIVWRSSDEKICSLNKDTLIGNAEGKSIITASVDGNDISSIIVNVHTHDWQNITQIVHHDDEGHYEEWDETVVDVAAYDETIVDKEAYDEYGIVQAAYDEIVVDVEAYDEKIIDQEYVAPTYHQEFKCFKCGRSGNLGQSCSDPICRNRGGYIIEYSWEVPGQEEISHIVHHDAVTHVEHHDAEYGNIHHDAITHIVHHDAVTHIVHHDAIYNENDFSKGDKNHWIVDKESYDEEVIIGHKCSICNKVENIN